MYAVRPVPAAATGPPIPRKGRHHMKNFAVVLLALAIASSAVAQTRSIHAGFRANVPFDFTIGTQTFRAGTYQFQRPLGKPSAGAGVGMIAVRSIDGSAYKAVMTALARPSVDKSADTKIVFKKHDGQWQLIQTWKSCHCTSSRSTTDSGSSSRSGWAATPKPSSCLTWPRVATRFSLPTSPKSQSPSCAKTAARPKFELVVATQGVPPKLRAPPVFCRTSPKDSPPASPTALPR